MATTLESLSVELSFARQEIARLEGKIDKLDQKVDALDQKVEKYYLTIKQFETEFKPIRNIIYGMVGAVLLAVLSALLYIVINKGGP